MRGVRQAVLVVVVVAAGPLVTASTCTNSSPPPLIAACDVGFGGVEIRQGLLVETITAVCDPQPRRHLLRAGLEQRVGDLWIERGRGRVADVIPDAAGLPVEVAAPCEEGIWRSWVRVEGVGPLPTAEPFRFSDTGVERAVELVECAG